MFEEGVYLSRYQKEAEVNRFKRKLQAIERTIKGKDLKLSHWMLSRDRTKIEFLQCSPCGCGVIADEMKLPPEWVKQIQAYDEFALNGWIDEMEDYLRAVDYYKRASTYNVNHGFVFLLPQAWGLMGGGCGLCCQDEEF